MSQVHTCHAYRCEVPVPPKMFMCKKHWYKLPKHMRDGIWARYRPGQEIDKRPTIDYINYADMCIKWLYKKQNKEVKKKENNQGKLF